MYIFFYKSFSYWVEVNRCSVQLRNYSGGKLGLLSDIPVCTKADNFGSRTILMYTFNPYEADQAS